MYYPYIHIRSEHWLKGTLLCAPSVKRIVPKTYTPEDVPHIARYVSIQGPNGALLQSVPAYSPAADAAQQRLLEKIRTHEDQIQRRFQRSQAPRPDECWIHDAKFNNALLDYLVHHGLAWWSHHGAAYGHRSWYGLHPALGSAIMTTLGLSIAREQQYDIVTPSIRREDIPELQASKYFQRFQQMIRRKARSIDRNAGPDSYGHQLTADATGSSSGAAGLTGRPICCSTRSNCWSASRR